MAEEFTQENESAQEQVSGAAAQDAAPEQTPPQEPEDQIAGEDSQAEAPELSELDQALLKVAELTEQLARRNADVYNVQQEYSNYVKRSKQENINAREAGVAKVLETLLSVLDNAHLAREHGELTGPAGMVVEELENTLATNFYLTRFGAVGDAFDPQIHEALMHQTSSEVDQEEVAQLIQVGYRQGEKVLRPARVGVVSPAE